MLAELPLPPIPTLIYDGECGFCRESVELVRRWDREHRLAMVPFQDQERVAAFGIPLTALAAAMHLVLPDGRVFAGADAAPELLRLLPGKRWVAWPLPWPGGLALREAGVRVDRPPAPLPGAWLPGSLAWRREVEEFSMTVATLNADAVRTALRQVKDPELDLNIIDLGLVNDVEIDEGEVRVTMT